MVAASDILLGLQIAIAVMAIVVLYHVLFIVVDVRKIVRRVDDVTSQLEEVILKPLSLADQALTAVMQFIEKKYEESTQEDRSKKK